MSIHGVIRDSTDRVTISSPWNCSVIIITAEEAAVEETAGR